MEAIKIMMDDAMVVLTHITPDVMADHADLVGPAEPAVIDTSRIWNIWEWRWIVVPEEALERCSFAGVVGDS